MVTRGEELERQNKTWNPRRRLGVRRDIKEFSKRGFELYILTVVLHTIYVNVYSRLTKDTEKITDHQTTAFFTCFLKGYYPGFRYSI